MSTFGERLRQCREAAGLTQEELADICVAMGQKMQKQSISRYETGSREPNIRIAGTLANALGVSLEVLQFGEEEKPEFPQMTMIGRAAAKMTEEQREKMLQLLKIAFPEEFE